MTKHEMASLLEKIKSAYGAKFIVDKDVLDVWYETIGDINYTQASEALRRHMRVIGFAPSIADIFHGVDEIREEEAEIRRSVNQYWDILQIYPDAEKARDVFFGLVNGLPKEKQVRGAKYLFESALNALEDAENGGEFKQLTEILSEASRGRNHKQSTDGRQEDIDHSTQPTA